jgi:hypothetical protein
MNMWYKELVRQELKQPKCRSKTVYSSSDSNKWTLAREVLAPVFTNLKRELSGYTYR